MKTVNYINALRKPPSEKLAILVIREVRCYAYKYIYD